MAKKKGCLNPNCPSHEKRKMYDEAYIRCPDCGEILSYVCKGCYMKLPNGAKTLCVRCEEEKKDKRKLFRKNTGKAFAGAAAIAVVAIKKIVSK
ncbi:MAG: hypothetical protein IJM61_06390 [Firmicutes bacterium]|nr:hypothetical protein [Bacillota bacterium]